MKLKEATQYIEDIKNKFRAINTQSKIDSKLSPQNRLNALIDPNSFFLEIGSLVGYNHINNENNFLPGASLIGGIGMIHNEPWVIIVSNYYNKSGSWLPETSVKFIRLQQIALLNKLPIVYVLEGAGIFLPLQHKIIGDKDSIGRCITNMFKVQNAGLFQISAIVGPCIAAVAFIALSADEKFISETEGSVCLAGTYLTKASIGQEIDIKELGGSKVLSEESGSVEYVFSNEEACLKGVRNRIKTLNKTLFPIHSDVSVFKEPELSLDKFISSFPDGDQPYNMFDFILSIVDGGSWLEYKPNYGSTLICGYATMGGISMAIITQQRLPHKYSNHKIEMGGVIYKESLIKCSSFLDICSKTFTPILFVQDVMGFITGKESEHGGIVKLGVELFKKISNLSVPMATLIIKHSSGTAGSLFGSKIMDPNFIFSWPISQICIMQSKEIINVILQSKLKKLKKEDNPDFTEIKKSITDKFEQTTSAIYAASESFVDEIIDPHKTRDILIASFKILNNCIKK